MPENPSSTSFWRASVCVSLGLMMLIVAWALSTPLMLVPDEASHTIRSVGLWHGDLVGERILLEFEGPPRVEADNFLVTLPAGFTNITSQTECYENGLRPAGCAPPLTPAPGTIEVGTSAGAYHPLWYALYGWGSRLLSPTESIYAGRISQGIVAALMIGVAAGLAARLRGRTGVLLTLLAATPSGTFLMGSVNPNGGEIAAAILLWVAVAALIRDPRSVVAAAGTILGTAGVAWSRPLSFATVAGVVVIVLLAGGRTDFTEQWAAIPFRRGVQMSLAVWLGSIVWILATGAASTFIRIDHPELTPTAAAYASLARLDDRWHEMIGQFGFLNIDPPRALTALGLVTVAGVALLGLRRTARRVKLAVLLVALGAVALPVVAEVLTAQEYGLAWQGRYTIPIAVGIILVGVPHAARVPTPVAVLAIASFAIVHLGSLITATRAVSTGAGSGVFAFLSGGAWHPPGPDLLPLALACFSLVPLSASVWLTDGGDADDSFQRVG